MKSWLRAHGRSILHISVVWRVFGLLVAKLRKVKGTSRGGERGSLFFRQINTRKSFVSA